MTVLTVGEAVARFTTAVAAGEGVVEARAAVEAALQADADTQWKLRKDLLNAREALATAEKAEGACTTVSAWRKARDAKVRLMVEVSRLEAQVTPA